MRVTLAVLFALTHEDQAGIEISQSDIFNNMLRLDALLHQQMTFPDEIAQGTILKYDNDHYFVCITPLCDTARLTHGYHAYTFLRGKPALSFDKLEASHDYCVFVDNGKPICLHIDLKRPQVFEINEENRKIDQKSSLAILARYKILPPRNEIASDKTTAQTEIAPNIPLTIVGQLRTDFFLMLTTASASNASRVGVNRAEMIRFIKSSN